MDDEWTAAGRLLAEPSALAAAALLRAAPASDLPPALAADVPTRVADRVRGRLHAAPFPEEQVVAWRRTSTWQSCSCATRCSSSPWGSRAPRRRVCGSATPRMGEHRTVLYQLASRCAAAAAALTWRGAPRACPRAARSAYASRLWTRAAAIAPRQPARGRPGRARAAPAFRELHPPAAGRAHVLRWLGRPLFACVDFLLTTKVRAPPRTQPLTAHAHVLTVCCACVLKQERGHRSCGKLGHAAAFRPKLSQTPPRTPVLGTSCPQKCILVSEVLAF